MRTAYLMGAGASYGYSGSKTGINPPLATTFFRTFYRLMISSDLETRIGFIVSYIRDTCGLSYERIAEDFEENIESVFAEVHDKLLRQLIPSERDFAQLFSLSKTYDQFIFWFAHVLNEVQNGALDRIYSELVRRAGSDDVFITFNWDTLLDRVLAESGQWFPDDGYRVPFHDILERTWRPSRDTRSRWKLLKLHGSTNWLGPYATVNFSTGERTFLQTDDRFGYTYCLVDGSTHFQSYKDRWRPGYETYSYFFPPDDPVSGVPLMPILIPPTARKNFAEFSGIFNRLWSTAITELRTAQRLVIIGYSFPTTDKHAFSLLDAFLSGATADKRVEIIDPYPEAVAERVIKHVAGRCAVQVYGQTLADYLGITVVMQEESEYERWTMPSSTQRVFEDEALNRFLNQLISLNFDRRPFDLTTVKGERYLSCILEGEFATHMLSAFREEIFSHRTTHIPLSLDNGKVVDVRLDDIEMIVPLPHQPLTPEQVSEVDLSLGDEIDESSGRTLREMIECSYHAYGQERNRFLRRVLAAISVVATEVDSSDERADTDPPSSLPKANQSNFAALWTMIRP